jgi:hypothetical protein
MNQRKTGTLKPAQVLEEQQTKTSIAQETIWYDRSQPLMHGGWFYVAEQRPFKPAQVPDKDYWQAQWVLLVVG